MRKKGSYIKLGFLGLGLISTGGLVLSNLNGIGEYNIATAKAEDYGFARLDVDGNDLKLLFSSDISEYTHLSGAKLKSFTNALFDNFSDIFSDNLLVLTEEQKEKDEQDQSSRDQIVEEFLSFTFTNKQYAYTPKTTYDPELLNKIVNAVLRHAGEADIDKVDNFNDDPTGAYSLTIAYYADRYANYHTEFSKVDIFEDIIENVKTIAQNVTDSAYSSLGYEQSDIPEAAVVVIEYLRSILMNGIEINLNDLTKVMSVVESAIEEDDTITVSSFIQNMGNQVVDEVKETILEADAQEIFDFFTSIDPELLIESVNLTQVNREEMDGLVNKLGLSMLISIADEIGPENVREILDASNGYKASDFREFVKHNMTKLSITDIFNAVKSLKLNGNTIIESRQFSKSGIKNFINSLPRPSEIAQLADEDMNVRWKVQMATSVGYAEFYITLGFFGDCSLIRTVMDYIARAIDFSYENGTFNLHIRSGDILAKVARKFISTNVIPHDIKVNLYKLFFSSVSEIYDHFENTMLSDIISELQQIDYASAFATVMSADFLNNILRTNRITDENIDRAIDGFMSLFRLGDKIPFDRFMSIAQSSLGFGSSTENQIRSYYNKFISLLDKIAGRNINSEMFRKLIDVNDDSTSNETIYNAIAKLSNYEKYYLKAQDLLTKVYNNIPARLLDKTIMSAYQGNGLWNIADSFNFDLKSILMKASSNYGETIYNALETYFGDVPSSIKFDFSFSARDMYSVDYVYGDNDVFRAALPTNVDVGSLLERTSINGYDIVKWVDVDGNEISTMTTEDITVYPVCDFDVVTTDDIEKEFSFTDEAEILQVNAYPEGNYTYQWYKDGVAISNATSNTYSVFEVKDSGVYTCEVTNESGLLTKTSEEINVQIDALEISVDDLDWNYPTDGFSYDGTAHTVSVIEANLPEGVNVAVTGDVTKTAAGTYLAVATISLEDAENTKFVTDQQLIFQLVWEIKDTIIHVDNVIWDYTNPFVYDGKEHEVNVVLSSLPEGVEIDTITGNKATNANQNYVATVTLKASNPLYKIEDSSKTWTLNWKINQAVVDVSNLTWTADTFTYTGVEFKTELESFEGQDLVTLSYQNNKYTSAGQYTAYVTITLIDNVNYRLSGNAVQSHDWEITQAQVVIPTLTWNYTDEEYTGNEFEVLVADFTGIEYLNVSYTGNKATNPGNFTATVTFTLKDSTNYELIGNAVQSHNWSITGHTVTITHLTWNLDSVEYNGNEVEVKLNDDPDLAFFDIVYTNNKKTNAGQYTATVTLTLKTQYQPYVTVVGSTQLSHDFEITKVQINIPTLTWNLDSVQYDGTEHVVTFTNYEVSTHLNVSFTGNKATNAGQYTATATFTLKDTVNYEIVGDAVQSHDYEITKVQINLTAPTWSFTEETYTGSEFENVIADFEGINLLNVSYLNNKATIPGNYESSVTFTLKDATNYEMVGNTTYTHNWKINRRTITISNFIWSLDSATYSGKTYSVKLLNHKDLAYLNIVYGGVNSAINVGQYTATATLSVKTEHAPYIDVVGSLNLSHDWEIVKANIYLGTLTWNIDSIVYDGNEHTATADYSMYANVLSATYTNNKGTNVGQYTSTITITLLDTANYNIIGSTVQSHDWEITTLYLDVPTFSLAVDEFTYDGTLKTTNLATTIDANLFEVVFTNNTATDAGDYTALATITVKDTLNTALNGNGQVSLNWKINKANVDTSILTWSTDSFVYNGQTQTVTLLPSAIDNLINISYSNNAKVDANQYTATASISLKDSSNYALVGSSTLSHDWEITPKGISISGVSWNYTSEYTYNGNEQSVTIVASSVPSNVSLSYSGTVAATNAGSYTAIATFTVTSSNYVIEGTNTSTLIWVIKAQTINVNEIIWNYENAYTYNGQAQSVSVDEACIPEGVVVNYSGVVSATNAGLYTATATLSVESNNYVLSGITSSNLNWEIKKAQIDISVIEFQYYESHYTYDGARHGVYIDATTIPEHVTVTINGTNSAVDAGNYSATFKFGVDNENYVLVGETSKTIVWAIDKAIIDVNPLTWNYDPTNPYVYTGQEKVVKVNEENSLHEQVVLTYSGTTKATYAGEYVAHYLLTAASNNYELRGTITGSLNWKILKATVTIGEIVWLYDEPILYDGKEHEVKIDTTDIPNGVEVTYGGVTKATKAGNYRATVTLSLNADLVPNYELKGIISDALDWEIYIPVAEIYEYISEAYENDYPLGIVRGTNYIPGRLIIEQIDASELKALKWNKIVKNKSYVHAYYTAYFLDVDGNRIELTSDEVFDIQLLIPATSLTLAKDFILVSVGRDGSLNKLNSTKDGNYMEFNSNLLSDFAIVEVGTSSLPWWVYAWIAVSVVAILVETYIIIIDRKRMNKDK